MADNVGELTLAVQNALARVNGLKQESSDYAMSVIGSILGDGVRACFVDPITGNDNNHGLTAQTAVKTLGKACSFSRYNIGLLNITLLNDTYVGGGIIKGGGYVQISGVNRSVKLIYDGKRIAGGFNGINLMLFNLTVHFKKRAAGTTAEGVHSCFFASHGPMSFFIFNSDMLIDADADTCLCQGLVHSLTLLRANIVLVNDGTTMNGHWVELLGSGTDPLLIPNLTTNMRKGDL